MPSKSLSVIVGVAGLLAVVLSAAAYLNSPIPGQSKGAGVPDRAASSMAATDSSLVTTRHVTPDRVGSEAGADPRFANSLSASGSGPDAGAHRVRVLETVPPPRLSSSTNAPDDTDRQAHDDTPSSQSVGTRAPGAGLVSTTEALPTTAQAAPPLARKLPLPLAFQEFDPVASGLTDAQTNLLNSLRESFVQEVGGANQNPNDPRYAERWRKAAPANDAQLRLFFGAQFVEELQLQQAQAEQAALTASAGRR